MRERHVKGRVEKGGEEGEGEKNQTIDKGQGRGVGGWERRHTKGFPGQLGVNYCKVCRRSFQSLKGVCL